MSWAELAAKKRCEILGRNLRVTPKEPFEILKGLNLRNRDRRHLSQRRWTAMTYYQERRNLAS